MKFIEQLMSGYIMKVKSDDVCKFCRDEVWINYPYKQDEELYDTKLRELEESWNQPCLYWEADCHGDSMTLCKRHLLELADLLN